MVAIFLVMLAGRGQALFWGHDIEANPRVGMPIGEEASRSKGSFPRYMFKQPSLVPRSRSRRDISETQKRSLVGSQGYGVSKLPGFGLSSEGPNRLAVAVHFGRLEDRNAPPHGVSGPSALAYPTPSI
jgi:hypothetical protein